MTSILAPQYINGCFEGTGIPRDLIGGGCVGSTSVLWSVVEKPVGSATTISAPTNNNTQFTPDVPGVYEVELCCFFPPPDGPVPDLPEPNEVLTIECPKGAVAGTVVYVPLSNCTGTVEWFVTGPFTAFAGDANGLTIFTDPDTTGTIFVSVLCTDTDINNQQSTTTDDCNFPTYGADEITMCTISAPLQLEVQDCDGFCECGRRSFVVKGDDAAAGCVYSEINITVKDCEDPEEEICA